MVIQKPNQLNLVGALGLVLVLVGSWRATSENNSPDVKAQAQGESPRENWSMFRGGPDHTGVYEGTVPKKLEVVWEFEAGEAVDVSPSISDGRVYAAAFEGDFFCVDLDTGTKIWSRSWPQEDDYQVPVTSSPCVMRGKVYFGDEDGLFRALDAKTGADVFTFESGGEIISSPIVVGDRVLFGSYDGYLYCLHPDTGKLLWKFETDGKVHGTPGAVADRVMVAGCDEHLRVVHLDTGKEIDAIPLGSPSGSSAAILGNRVFAGTYGNEVVGADWKEGTILWRYEHPQRQFPFVSSAAITKDRVVIGGRDKMLHCLDSSTGKSVWTFRTRARVESSPVLVGDRVFFGSYDGKFYELSLETGKETWSFDTGSSIHSSPAIAEGKIVFGSGDGFLYCLGAKKE